VLFSDYGALVYVTGCESIARLGTAGVVLLLFFVGMETDILAMVALITNIF